MGQCLFPLNIAYAARIAGVGLAQATYVFDPSTFAQDEGSRQMRYRPTVDSDFSLLVMLHQEGRIDYVQVPRIRAENEVVVEPGFQSDAARRIRQGRDALANLTQGKDTETEQTLIRGIDPSRNRRVRFRLYEFGDDIRVEQKSTHRSTIRP
jgi:hypothetical protein